MVYAGIDLHRKSSHISAFDGEDTEILSAGGERPGDAA
jgi:hypothetical protein